MYESSNTDSVLSLKNHQVFCFCYRLIILFKGLSSFSTPSIIIVLWQWFILPVFDFQICFLLVLAIYTCRRFLHLFIYKIVSVFLHGRYCSLLLLVCHAWKILRSFTSLMLIIYDTSLQFHSELIAPPFLQLHSVE